MGLQERIYSVLIVSGSENFITAVRALLPPSQYQPVCVAHGINEAKRAGRERDFDFTIIDSPLPDETGIRFAVNCCHDRSAVVLLLILRDIHDEVHDRVAEEGVFTLPKPTSRITLERALGWMESARERLRKLQQKNLSVEEQIKEIRIINRAKMLLISELKMTEAEAHRYIEKSAMDNCISKKEISENIIKLYS